MNEAPRATHHERLDPVAHSRGRFFGNRIQVAIKHCLFKEQDDQDEHDAGIDRANALYHLAINSKLATHDIRSLLT